MNRSGSWDLNTGCTSSLVQSRLELDPSQHLPLPYLPTLSPVWTECTSASTMLWVGGPSPLLESQVERALGYLNDKDPQKQEVPGVLEPQGNSGEGSGGGTCRRKNWSRRLTNCSPLQAQFSHL